MSMSCLSSLFLFFFFFQAEDGIRDLTVTGVQTCALPICHRRVVRRHVGVDPQELPPRPPQAQADLVVLRGDRSEEHTSELQSQSNLVCRLLLEKKKKKKIINNTINTKDKQKQQNH